MSCIRVGTLIDILESLDPNAKVLINNDSLYEDGIYSVDSVDTDYAEEGYVILNSEYKTEYSEVI